MKILLFNQYAGNKGDRAVLYTTCKMIRDLYPDSVITVSTSAPEMYDGYSYYQEQDIRFIPSAWDYDRVNVCHFYWRLLRKVQKFTFTILREMYLRNIFIKLARFFINPEFLKAVRKADRIISVGGHHYCTLLSRDLVSGINFDAISIKLLKRNFVCFAQTFGPFNFYNIRNAQVTHKILNSSELYPREKDSRDQLLKFNVSESHIHMTYETVFGINSLITDYVKPSQRTKQVGISIYCTQKRNKETEENYLNCMAELCNHAIEIGYNVLFFPMELKGTLPDDRPYIFRIIERVNKKNRCRVIDADLESADHLREVSKCQLFVGHKTHSCIFALASGTPLLAVAYHPKTIEFMKQFDLKQFAVDDKQLKSDALNCLFDKLLTDMDNIGQTEFDKSRQFTFRIKETLDSIIANK